MLISGFLSMTLLDYPGKVAATVFTGGCNFKCPFCHNGDLVFEPKNIMSDKELFAFLKKRKGVLDGVCITGGEPTLQKDLQEILCQIKSIGYNIKLDTNGAKPDIIKTLLEGHLVDYIAMDIKASPCKYKEAAGVDNSSLVENVKQTASIIMNSGIDYEFRTTFVKGIHDKDEMQGIKEIIDGADAYYLQSYRESETVIGLLQGGQKKYEAFTKEEMQEYCRQANTFSKAFIRGID